MPELLPSDAAAYDKKIDRVTSPDGGRVTTWTYTGTKAAIEALEADFLQGTTIGGEIASLQYTELNGRATLSVPFARQDISGNPDDDGGVQELFSVDVTRDIRTAPYFSTLTNAEIDKVMIARDNQKDADAGWTPLQKSLFGHLARGQDTYNDTAYEFRQTWRTTSTKQLKAATANANTVQPLPKLTQIMARLIDSLPPGQWLKKPTGVQSIGKAGWSVTIVYQWAKQWSVIYGGSFTGL